MLPSCPTLPSPSCTFPFSNAFLCIPPPLSLLQLPSHLPSLPTRHPSLLTAPTTLKLSSHYPPGLDSLIPFKKSVRLGEARERRNDKGGTINLSSQEGGWAEKEKAKGGGNTKGSTHLHLCSSGMGLVCPCIPHDVESSDSSTSRPSASGSR